MHRSIKKNRRPGTFILHLRVVSRICTHGRLYWNHTFWRGGRISEYHFKILLILKKYNFEFSWVSGFMRMGGYPSLKHIRPYSRIRTPPENSKFHWFNFYHKYVKTAFTYPLTPLRSWEGVIHMYTIFDGKLSLDSHALRPVQHARRFLGQSADFLCP